MADKQDDPKRKSEHYVIATPTALVVTFDEEMHRQAKHCLEQSGKVTFSFKEISVTKLPQTLYDDGVKVD